MDRQFEFDNNFAERLRDTRRFQSLVGCGVITQLLHLAVLILLVSVLVVVSDFLKATYFPQADYVRVVVILPFVLLYYWFYGRYNLRRYKQKTAVERFEGKPVIVRVGNRGISWQQVDSEASFDWVGIDVIHQGPKGLLFQYGNIAYVLPNSVFPDKASRISFKEECETLMTKAKTATQ